MRPDTGTLRDPGSIRWDETQIPTRSSKSSFKLIGEVWLLLFLAFSMKSALTMSTGLILGAGGGDVRGTDSTESSE